MGTQIKELYRVLDEKFPYTRDREKNKSIRASRRREKRKLAIDIKGGVCVSCGQEDSCRLTFHHVEPDKKTRSLAKMWSKGWTKILRELKICIILCEECHNKYHRNELTLLEYN